MASCDAGIHHACPCIEGRARARDLYAEAARDLAAAAELELARRPIGLELRRALKRYQDLAVPPPMDRRGEPRLEVPAA